MTGDATMLYKVQIKKTWIAIKINPLFGQKDGKKMINDKPVQSAIKLSLVKENKNQTRNRWKLHAGSLYTSQYIYYI